MNLQPITRRHALNVTAQLLKALHEQEIPVRQIFLFGSASRDATHPWSDIDIAVICEPFLESKYSEQHVCSRAARAIDVRAEVVCLHPADLDNRYSTIAQEVWRHGIASA